MIAALGCNDSTARRMRLDKTAAARAAAHATLAKLLKIKVEIALIPWGRQLH